ncbi:MAG: hypothetical protein IJZ22_08475 [Bacteroidaceae bacterium]|nr:hypothetical protein [Bacteroidaceae bacterium]
MKKLLIYSWLPMLFATMAAFSFIACGDSDDADYAALARLLASKEENQYFKIEGAIYIENAMPESTSSVKLEDVTFENNILRIRSTQECNKFYIGAEGVNGYYEVNANADNTRAETIYYIIAIKLIQNSNTITIKSEYSDGSVSEIYKFKFPGEAVEIGLSVKWASYNVGAENPWEYGGYYAWGETNEKSNYDWDTYKYYNDVYVTKYCTFNIEGRIPDNKTPLEASDDVASVKWGGSWRMPTYEEQQELLENCTWEWTTLNGVNGYRVTGPNGNSIFLPAAGYIHYENINIAGQRGYYWSNSLVISDEARAIGLYFRRSSPLTCSHQELRTYGFSVRPVCP